MPILGKPMLERMIERVRHSRYVKQIVVATTDLPEDAAIVTLASRIGIGCFRGSAQDVLGRINAAAATYRAEVFLELLGDNPLVHADLIDDVIEFYMEGRFDYAANVTTEYPHAGAKTKKFPIGIRGQVFPLSVLSRCARLTHDSRHREHSTSFIYEHPELFRLGYFEAKGKWRCLNRPGLTLAVNYQEDLDVIRRIFERCYPIDANFPLSAVIHTLESDSALQHLLGAPW